LADGAARLLPGARRPGPHGASLFLPQADPSAPPLLRLRDFAALLEGCAAALSEAELRAGLKVFLDAQAADGTFPDSLRLDGTGGRPALDGVHEMIAAVWCAFRRLGDPALIEPNIPALVKGLRAVPRDARTDLVSIAPGPAKARCGGGFMDAVRLRGDVLFPSLLHVRGCQQLADLLQSLGRDGDADTWRAEGQHVGKRIRMYFWDKRPGLFKAAAGNCAQHDLWGSALAVYLNVATSGQLIAIAKYFQTHYAEVVRDGHLRHLPADECWEDTEAPRGTGQNGGYWAVPVGWLAYTLDIVSPDLAERTVLDLAAAFAADGVWQCLNEDGRREGPNYLASLALPAAGVRQMLVRREKRLEHAFLATV